MPVASSWFGGPKRLLWSFALVLLLPAVAVGWLGLRLIDQDRELESRQRLERRDIAGERVVAGLERAVAATERQLRDPRSGISIQPGADALLVTMRADGLDASPTAHLLFTPDPPRAAPEPTTEFTDGEALEFNGSHARAVESYKVLARSPDETIRAGALVRIGRTLRKMGRPIEALAVYEDLSRITRSHVAGLPGDLVGRRARTALLAELDRRDQLRASARELQADLVARRWALDRGTFVSYAGQVREWTGEEPPAMAEREALSDAVDWLWQEWRRGALTSAGRVVRRHGSTDVTVLWQPGAAAGPGQGDRVVGLVAGPRFLAREWVRSLAPVGLLDVAFVNPDPQVPRAAPAAAASALRRSAADTGLPWTLILTDKPGASDLDGSSSRRRVVLAGLALIVVVVLAGAVVVARGVSHELDVARLQSDFVSAVSHEFRTPLTSLQQFTAILNEDNEPPPAKRRVFYQAQARAVSRLQHLVESLLDFGRMEAGAYPYRPEQMPVGPFVSGLVAAFRGDGTPEGFVVDCAIDTDSGDITADRDALGRAIRNLLENAVKYSGDGRRIDVRATRRGRVVAVSVRDEGLGIPHAEQQRIFTKFVRGAASRMYGINGTGIGLAMAREIVRAHGGDITVESIVASGSTFTVTLPAADTARDAIHSRGSS
ncbi:Sensor histidine kinase YycG [Luteitalea pratensis]|uniref:histidine kinase n=1 Tax=Luteitalea pratensis TaxID=1855912 RepID=A0A143PVA4_LUTPR|nr:HAMP domain-containing sensor histidine kinase [Luteitalea pratensis]AMY12687.1 Sensor histidine kinase YycG [Luteitalea pratensis]